MINNSLRHGNFTSSEIVALTTIGKREMTDIELAEHRKANPKSKAKLISDGFGDSAMTYIKERNYERMLGRSLDSESYAKPLVWGKFCEGLVFDLLGMAYTLCSTETVVHPECDFWSGTPDILTANTVGDIKCPFTIKSFCQLVMPLYEGLGGIGAMNKIRKNHKDGEKYYWQLVSNSVLTNRKYAELIIYCPYFSEIEAIKAAADGNPDAHFIQFANQNDLPFILDGGFFNNINIIRFEVPESDKLFLTERVKEAGKMLLERKEVDPMILLAHYDQEAKATIIQ